MFFCGFVSFAGYQSMKSVQMSFVILTLFIFTANVKGQSIISGPSNVVSTVGRTAKFDCTADFAGGIETMQWQFNNDIIYAYEKGQEVFPRGRDKYSVKQDGKMFNLTVNNVGLGSSGEYSCRLITNSSTSLLTVLDTPRFSASTPNQVAGSEVEYVCKAKFSGPSKAGPLPQLRMYFDAALLDLQTQQEELEGPKNWYQLTQTYNIIPDTSTDGKKLMCDIGTSNPVMHINTTTEVMVVYWVHDVNYTPVREKYVVGTVINCTANGWPKPHFTWQDNKKKENWVKGPSLEVTEEMLGSNNWTCIAANTIGGKTNNKSVLAEFKAVHPGDSVFSEANTDDSASLMIGVGIGVSVGVCLLVIVLVLSYCRIKHKRPSCISPKTKRLKDTNVSRSNKTDYPGVIDPLLQETQEKDENANHSPKSIRGKVNIENSSTEKAVSYTLIPESNNKNALPQQDSEMPPQSPATNVSKAQEELPPQDNGTSENFFGPQNLTRDETEHPQEENTTSKDSLPKVLELATRFDRNSSDRDSKLGNQSSGSPNLTEPMQQGNIKKEDAMKPSTPLATNNEISKEKWVHRILPSKFLQLLLEKDGDFLIKVCDSGRAGYEMSYKWKDQIEHSPIQYEKGKWIFNRHPFGNAEALISEHTLAGKTVSLKSYVKVQEWELNQDDVCEVGPGNGNCKEVVRAEFQKETVAVKICKGTEADRNAILNDSYFLKKFEHKNIAKFIGLTNSKQPLMTVMEFGNGILLKYLQSQQEIQEKQEKLKPSQLVKMCKDVADGMTYLIDQHCIHRDLTAQNCLVGKVNTVKICNFFMAREVKEGEAYHAEESEPLPVKWTAPEALRDRKFTESSDIWSFGVLMWEIFALGRTPYEETHDSELLGRISSGDRLTTPQETPKDIYDIMKMCWIEEIDKRPKFLILPKKFTNIQKKFWTL